MNEAGSFICPCVEGFMENAQGGCVGRFILPTTLICTVYKNRQLNSEHAAKQIKENNTNYIHTYVERVTTG